MMHTIKVCSPGRISCIFFTFFMLQLLTWLLLVMVNSCWSRGKVWLGRRSKQKPLCQSLQPLLNYLLPHWRDQLQLEVVTRRLEVFGMLQNMGRGVEICFLQMCKHLFHFCFSFCFSLLESLTKHYFNWQ